MKRQGLTRLLVGLGDEGLRIDQLLARSTNLSRRKAREIISEGLVWRNQQPSRILSREVQLADVIDVLLSADELGAPAQPHHPEIQILHEDSWMMVAAKPAGVLSQPIAGGETRELAFDQQVMLALAARDGRPPFLRLVHRLDRLTSGAVLFARCAEALPPLSKLWREARVERRYLAVVQGLVDADEQEIDLPIARDTSHSWRFRTSATGRKARTRVKVLERRQGGQEGVSVLMCELITGRTHQVRVHLAAIGHPVLGDRLYRGTEAPEGRAEPAAPRPLLHALELALPHPRSGSLLRITCPPPSDLEPWISSLQLTPGP